MAQQFFHHALWNSSRLYFRKNRVIGNSIAYVFELNNWKQQYFSKKNPAWAIFSKKGVRIKVQFMIRTRKNFISTNSNRQYKKLHEFVKKVGFSLEVSRHPNISNFMVRYLIKLMRMTSGHSPTCSRFVRKKKFSGIFQYCYPWKFTDPFPMNFVVSRGRRKGAWKGFLPWIRNNESSDSSL